MDLFAYGIYIRSSVFVADGAGAAKTMQAAALPGIRQPLPAFVLLAIGFASNRHCQPSGGQSPKTRRGKKEQAFVFSSQGCWIVGTNIPNVLLIVNTAGKKNEFFWRKSVTPCCLPSSRSDQLFPAAFFCALSSVRSMVSNKASRVKGFDR